MSTTTPFPADLRVEREPGPYDADSPHSWIRDLVLVRDPAAESRSTTHDDAWKRLANHSRDVGEALGRNDAYGTYAARAISESVRPEANNEHEHRQAVREQRSAARAGVLDEELRALTTGGGTTVSATGGGAAAFVAPQILLSDWSSFRTPYRSFADQCATRQLPASGMEVLIPNVTTGTSVTVQTEGSSVTEEDPVTTFTKSSVAPMSGQVSVTQQFLDHAGPGIGGDAFIIRQLTEQLDSQVDSYALAQALTDAQTVTDNSAFTLSSATGVGGFLGDLKKAKSAIRNASGVQLNATHAFTTGNFTDYIAAYSDAQGRPIFTPTLDDNRLPIRSVGDMSAEGYTGYVLASLALFSDNNIPNVSSDLQIIVCRPDGIELLEGTAIPYIYPQSYAGSLLPIVGLRSYTACVPRWPTSIVSITGSAYTPSTFA